MGKAVLYIPERKDNTEEAVLFSRECKGYDMIDFSYHKYYPWEIKQSIRLKYQELLGQYDEVAVMAKGIGVYFAIDALGAEEIGKALFISPVIAVEKLILKMLSFSNISLDKLFEEQVVSTEFDQDLSWDMYNYYKENQISWCSEADIIVGSEDMFETAESIRQFADANNCRLTIIEGGDHELSSPEHQIILKRWLQEKMER